MNQKEVEISEKLFRAKYEQLGKQEKHVAHHLVERTHIARNVAQEFSEQMTFGQKLADKVAAYIHLLIMIPSKRIQHAFTCHQN